MDYTQEEGLASLWLPQDKPRVKSLDTHKVGGKGKKETSFLVKLERFLEIF